MVKVPGSNPNERQKLLIINKKEAGVRPTFYKYNFILYEKVIKYLPTTMQPAIAIVMTKKFLATQNDLQ